METGIVSTSHHPEPQFHNLVPIKSDKDYFWDNKEELCLHNCLFLYKPKRITIMWSDWKERIKANPQVRPSLLWEYDLSDFNWQYMRDVVVQRVIERGWDDDYYAIFSLYGGIEGVRRILRDEVLILSKKEMAFVCATFNLKKEELKCYIRKQSREALLSY